MKKILDRYDVIPLIALAVVVALIFYFLWDIR